MAQADLVIPHFKTLPIKNDAKSKEAGRPIFDEIEVVEVRLAGNNLVRPVFPAHDVWTKRQNEFGDWEDVTYAQRWSEQYKKFKEGRTQTVSGTPLDELPFLSAAKRSELKALSIYTAEALAALDGTPLKTLGQGGRELKTQAQAYLDNATGSAKVVQMAAEIAELKALVASLAGDKAAPTTNPVEVSPFNDMPDDELKQYIKEVSGQAPRGNPSHETLVRMAIEAERQKEAA